VNLSCKYIGNKFLPDKAIDILDEAGASFMLADSQKVREVTKETIEDTLRMMGHLPKNQKSDSKQRLKLLESELKKQIYGQDEAIEKLASCVKRNSAGFAENKPMGSFLFSGPTGVGKTEISKQLASALQIKFLRFDMSEYMEQHSVSRLIGAPPGYVGYEQRGLLTDAISKTPHCVLLLDEIEKAHPDIYNILLQVMDNATLTDNFGTKIDFQYVILIMTSNVGSQNGSKNFMGFGDQDHTKEKQALRTEFAPEFLNRLSATIHFSSLSEENILKVVSKNLKALKINLLARGIILNVKMSAKRWLMKEGYDVRLGARPIERLIQKKIKDKLAEEILFGSLQEGGKVTLSSKNKELDFCIQSLV
jgi:ATP-dependent Clp protease ATP-binding subunit ClpA